jgi:predicted 3-demethylubiquinone-9 3-methyltransferase (glyoxalase superfamily)
VPSLLGDIVSHPNRERAKRVTEAMIGMVKIDIAAREKGND